MPRFSGVLAALALGVVAFGASLTIVAPEPAAAAPGDWGVTATTIDMGSVYVGDQSDKYFITITNTSAVALPLPIATGALTPGAGFELTSDNCIAGGVYNPGENCSYTFTFIPVAAGPALDTLAFTLDGVPYTATLTGVGLTGFTVSPATVDFGPIVVGQSAPTSTVTVTNISPVTLSPSFGFGTPTSTDFTYQSTCGLGLMAPGATCEFHMDFVPSALGPISATVILQVDTELVTLTLLGSGVTTQAAAPVASPTGSTLADSGPPDALPPLALAFGLIALGVGARLGSRRARVVADR